MRGPVRFLAVLLVAVACTSGDQRQVPPQQDAPPRGGVLRAGVPDFEALVVDLDPQRAYAPMPWELFRCCLLRTLYSYSGRPTEEGGAELRADLAVGSPDVSADGLTWTFQIRDGLRYAPPFEDTPITSLDFVRALERTARISSPDVGYGYFYYDVIRGFVDYGSGAADSIVGLETPDARTLVVRLDRVTSDLAYRFSLPATAPIPEGGDGDGGNGEDSAHLLAASGPYMIEGSEQLDPSASEEQRASGFVPAVVTDEGAVREAGSLALVRNPSWDPVTDRLRPAYPDRIELVLGGDLDDLARSVEAGTLDLVFGSPSPFEQVARYRDDPALDDRLFVHANDIVFTLTMNLAIPPFDDIHVRRAVSLAIDKVGLVERLSKPPYGPFGNHPGEVATHVAPDTLEGRLLRAFDPYPHDPAAAQAEMRGSAYDRTGDGRCDVPVCRNVRTLVMDAGALPEQARAIREDLASVGIELALRIEPVPRFFGDVDPSESIHDPRSLTAMGIAYPWAKDFPEGAGWFQPLFVRSGLEGPNTSLLGATPDQLRDWGYRVTSVPNVDDRVQACLERRGVSRTQCWAELDQYLMTEVVPWVPIVFMAHAQVVSERVVAYSFDQFGSLPSLDRIALAPGSG